jgi:hypothetical protein
MNVPFSLKGVKDLLGKDKKGEVSASTPSGKPGDVVKLLTNFLFSGTE